MAKCIYCYRDSEIWKHDPILLPNGAKYKWSDVEETTLVDVPNIEDRIYKGIYQIREDEVIEIQDKLKELEEENLLEIDRTIFSPLNTSGKFQITGKHIKEMRDSVEKLLDAIGLTKTDYFNYDEEGNHIIHPNGDKLEWTDPITITSDLQKFQVKYIHIEDLRHYIELFFQETWEASIPAIYTTDSYFIGDQSKLWRAVWNPGLAPSSYVQVSTIKDVKCYGVALPLTGTEPFQMIRYYQWFTNKFPARQNCRVYFDVNSLNIIPEVVGTFPWQYSLDNFFILVHLRTYHSNGKEFPIYYRYNYNPTYYKQGPFSLQFYDVLKGNIVAPTSIINNLYDDCIIIHDGTHPSYMGPTYVFKSYYDGTIDTRGCYVSGFAFGTGMTNTIGGKIAECTLDNIKVTL